MLNQAEQMIYCEAGYDLSVMGRGAGVAVLNTGVFLYEDSEDRVVVSQDILQRRNKPYGDNGHRTHISAITGGAGIVSRGRHCGVAPGCNLISVKVLDKKGDGYASDMLAGIRRMRENKDRYGIWIANISVGSYSRKNMSENSALVKGVNAAWDDDLVVVVAVGSQRSGRMIITTPSISRKVIMVGCSNDHKGVDVTRDRMVDYFGWGPTKACTHKPDVMASGSSIISCTNAPGRYMIKSRTNMSMPLVSGAITLLLEKCPDINNRDMKLRLRERCVDLELPKNQQGWSGLDVRRLLE